MVENEKIENKSIYKKWWFWVIMVVALVFIGFCIYMVINNNSAFNNYKNQSVSILNDYKKGKITREEAKNRIESISDKVSKDYANDNTSKMLFLSSELQRIEWDFVKGELSDTEINNYIREIKNIKDI